MIVEWLSCANDGNLTLCDMILSYATHAEMIIPVPVTYVEHFEWVFQLSLVGKPAVQSRVEYN